MPLNNGRHAALVPNFLILGVRGVFPGAALFPSKVNVQLFRADFIPGNRPIRVCGDDRRTGAPV